MTENLYEKYYLSDDKVIKILNQDGVVIFDTSALLSLYYYSDSAREQIIQNAFIPMKDRLWIPAQVYFEFLKNKGKVSHKPQESYDLLLKKEKNSSGCVSAILEHSKDIKDKEIKAISGQIKTFQEQTSDNTKHPFIEPSVYAEFLSAWDKFQKEVDVFLEATGEFDKTIREEINKKKKGIEEQPDNIEKFISDNFSIGKEYSFEKMMSIGAEGRLRYSEKIPPGYMDAKEKEGIRKYGDLFAWKQILDYGKSNHCNALLVINDVKEDWWDKDSKAPRVELLKEYNSISGKSFWSCKMDEFLHLINQSGSNKIDDRVIEEAGILSDLTFDQDEQARFYYDIAKAWLRNNSEYILRGRIAQNQDWRVFGEIYVYKAVTFDGEDSIVILNILKKYNYASALHAVRNGQEIRKYYRSFGKEYRYRQLIVTKSKETADTFCDLMGQYTKLKRFFYIGNMENTLLYLENGVFTYVASNCGVG